MGTTRTTATRRQTTSVEIQRRPCPVCRPGQARAQLPRRAFLFHLLGLSHLLLLPVLFVFVLFFLTLLLLMLLLLADLFPKLPVMILVLLVL